MFPLDRPLVLSERTAPCAPSTSRAGLENRVFGSRSLGAACGSRCSSNYTSFHVPGRSFDSRRRAGSPAARPSARFLSTLRLGRDLSSSARPRRVRCALCRRGRAALPARPANTLDPFRVFTSFGAAARGSDAAFAVAGSRRRRTLSSRAHITLGRLTVMYSGP
ncbi:hypothetical protein EVAR_102441_1 [Eumeta japonica]|uniref:Uncharacterized protein n=1 Tax=Eumeta variegata TaxID=151549 RepID=A0A4C1YVL8_EUMVA|nr:hypothetical protein EVAR_102441_1 [Eumeta japonica]